MILTGYKRLGVSLAILKLFCHWDEVLWDMERVIEEHSLLKIDFGPNSTLPAKEGRNIKPLSVSLAHFCSRGLEFDNTWEDIRQ